MTIKERLRLWNPVYWPAWLGISCLWLLTRLPHQWQLSLGRGLGRLLYRIAPKIRHITETNINLCFPELSVTEKAALVQANFAAVGMGVMETAMAWWLSDKRLAHCDTKLEGLEHLETAIQKGKGVILLGPHFTCLEMVGRLLGARFGFAVLYRPHKKYLLSYIQERFRQKYKIQQIARHRMRELIHAFENKKSVWYAYDVDGGEKRSVFAPFFNIPTASLTAISRLVTLTGATVLPVSFYRSDDRWGYDIKIQAPLENFPSDNHIDDATRLNQYIEQSIREKPEQYIWQYKRFKTRPQGEKRFY